MRRLHKERGGSLIMVVMMTFVLSIIAASMLQIALQGYKESVNSIQREQAYRIAESGLSVYQRLLHEYAETRGHELTVDDRAELAKQIGNQLVLYRDRSPELLVKAGEDQTDEITVSGKTGIFSQEFNLTARLGKGIFGKHIVMSADSLPENLTETVIVKQEGAEPPAALAASDLAAGINPASYMRELKSLQSAIEAVHPFPMPEKWGMPPEYRDNGSKETVSLHPMNPIVRSAVSQGDLIIELDCDWALCTVTGPVNAGRDLIIACAEGKSDCALQRLVVQKDMTAGRDIVIRVPFSNLAVNGNIIAGRDLITERNFSATIGTLSAEDAQKSLTADPMKEPNPKSGNIFIFGNANTKEGTFWNNIITYGDVWVKGNFDGNANWQANDIKGSFYVGGDVRSQFWNDSKIGRDLLFEKKWVIRGIRSVSVQGIVRTGGNVSINEISGWTVGTAMSVDGTLKISKISGDGFQVTGESARLSDAWKHLHGLTVIRGSMTVEEAGKMAFKGFLAVGGKLSWMQFLADAKLKTGGLAARDGLDFGVGVMQPSLVEIRLKKPSDQFNGSVYADVYYDPEWKQQMTPVKR